jgi:hypothetical protein
VAARASSEWQLYAGASAQQHRGAFSVPATDLAFEWGPSSNDIRHRGSLRGSSASFGYAFSFGSRRVASGSGVSITQAAGGALTVNVANSEAVARYRLNLSVNMQNLFNRPTYSGYSGVLTSPLFLQPTSASGVRRTTMNINLTF